MMIRKYAIFMVAACAFYMLALAYLVHLLRDETPAPSSRLTLESVHPSQGRLGEELQVILKGAGFDATTRVSLSIDSGHSRGLTASLYAGGNLHNIAIAGKTAFLANASRGLQAVDISIPSSPRLLSTLKTPGKPWCLVVKGEFLYLGDGGALRIVDIADPEQMQILGAVETGGNIVDLAFRDDVLFAADSIKGLHAFDLSEPARPKFLGSLHRGVPMGVALMGSYAYVAAARAGVQVVDIRDPRRMQLAAVVQVPGIALGISVHEGYGFIAAGREGMVMVDLQDPLNPRLLAHRTTAGTAWKTILHRNRVYVACSQGLSVFDLRNPRNPDPLGTLEVTGVPRGIAFFDDIGYLPTAKEGLKVISLEGALEGRSIQGIENDHQNEVRTEERVYLTVLDKGILVADLNTDRQPAALPWISVEDGNVPKILETENFLFGLITRKKSPNKLAVWDKADRERLGEIVIGEVPTNLELMGDTAWVLSSRGALVYDVSDPRNVRLASDLPLTGGGSAAAFKDNRLYLGSAGGTLHVFDVTRPENPELLGEVALPWHMREFSQMSEIAILGEIACVADGVNGLVLFSLANPDLPKLVGYLPLEGNTKGVRLSGHLAYVSNSFSGLNLVDIGNPATPQLIASVGPPSDRIIVRKDSVIFFKSSYGTILPLPRELTDIRILHEHHLAVRIPTSIPGAYTIRVFNEHAAAELPGAIVFKGD